jgi:hypothetical protein
MGLRPAPADHQLTALPKPYTNPRSKGLRRQHPSPTPWRDQAASIFAAVSPVNLQVECATGSQAKMPHTATCGSVGEVPSCKMNRGGDSWLVANDACGVPFPGQILCQVYMAGTEAVHAAVGEADLHFTL